MVRAILWAGIAERLAEYLAEHPHATIAAAARHSAARILASLPRETREPFEFALREIGSHEPPMTHEQRVLRYRAQTTLGAERLARERTRALEKELADRRRLLLWGR